MTRVQLEVLRAITSSLALLKMTSSVSSENGRQIELQEKQIGLQGGQYAVLQINATYVMQSGVTLKKQ